MIRCVAYIIIQDIPILLQCYYDYLSSIEAQNATLDMTFHDTREAACVLIGGAPPTELHRDFAGVDVRHGDDAQVVVFFVNTTISMIPSPAMTVTREKIAANKNPGTSTDFLPKRSEIMPITGADIMPIPVNSE